MIRVGRHGAVLHSRRFCPLAASASVRRNGRPPRNDDRSCRNFAGRRARGRRRRAGSRPRQGDSGAAARHADDGAIYRDQGRQSGLSFVLPDGRFLRAVFPRCRRGFAGARHRAHQTRQASRPRHPDVRRADRARRRISASADRARPPRRRVRAARRSGRSAQARHQERRAARRRAAGDARHADRGFAAPCRQQQLPAGAGARAPILGRGPLCARLDRYLDRRLSRRRVRAGGSRRGDRPHRAGRDHRVGRAVRRPRVGAVSALAAVGDAAYPRHFRRRYRRATAGVVLRRADQRFVRHVLAHRDRRRRGGRHLCRADADRQAPAAVAADSRDRRRDARDRPCDPQQSRNRPHAGRRAARFASRRHRSHHDGGGSTAPGAAPRRTADRCRRDRAPFRCGRRLRQRQRRTRRIARALESGARSGARADPHRRRPRRSSRPRRHPRRHLRRRRHRRTRHGHDRDLGRMAARSRPRGRGAVRARRRFGRRA